MAWVIGDLVTIDDSGNITGGSGARLALFNARKDEMPKPTTFPPLLDPNSIPPPIIDETTHSEVSGWDESVMGSWAVFANDNNAQMIVSWAKNLQKLVDECNNIAQGIIAFALSNIEISVTVRKFEDIDNPGDSGLQSLPEVLEENEPTKAPIEDKVLHGEII